MFRVILALAVVAACSAPVSAQCGPAAVQGRAVRQAAPQTAFVRSVVRQRYTPVANAATNIRDRWAARGGLRGRAGCR